MTRSVLTLVPLHPSFGVEVRGVDLRTSLDDATFGAVREAFETHSVLLFRDQPLTDDEQVAFSLRFGSLEEAVKSRTNYRTFRPEIVHLSNLDADGQTIPMDDIRMVYNFGNQLWQSDSSFKRVPALASLLSAREVPDEGGETEFASTRLAYERLPGDLQRRLEGLVCIHDFEYSRGLVAPGLLTAEHKAQVPPVRQVLVRVNPVNGRRGALHRLARPGDRRAARGRRPDAPPALLEVATEPASVYRHAWRRET
jgi:alpha-ketoglutarate-dependent 2,4-dichlorophenoxyacetate dioxygenase